MGARLGAMVAACAAALAAPGPAPLAPIALECSGAAASDTHARRHVIRNPTRHAIPKRTVVEWTASDHGKGSITLARDLPPGASVVVNEPGRTAGYTCTASFVPGDPDLVVKSVRWTSATTATIEIENVYPFRDAPASVVRVQSLRCLATPVASVDVPVPAIPKGATVTVTATIARDGADYLKATANATRSLHEANTGNNDGVSPDFVTNRSCTPH